MPGDVHAWHLGLRPPSRTTTEGTYMYTAFFPGEISNAKLERKPGKYLVIIVLSLSEAGVLWASAIEVGDPSSRPSKRSRLSQASVQLRTCMYH